MQCSRKLHRRLTSDVADMLEFRFPTCAVSGKCCFWSLVYPGQLKSALSKLNFLAD